MTVPSAENFFQSEVYSNFWFIKVADYCCILYEFVLFFFFLIKLWFSSVALIFILKRELCNLDSIYGKWCTKGNGSDYFLGDGCTCWQNNYTGSKLTLFAINAHVILNIIFISTI